MKSQQIKGRITGIQHRNAEDWCALELDETISVTGILPKMADIGSEVTCDGSWITNKLYGKQFKATQIIPEKPDTDSEAGVFALLKRLPGIGPVKAQKAIDTHGYTQAWVLAKTLPEALGIPTVLCSATKELAASFEDDFQALIFFLGAGLTPHECTKIIKKYGSDAIAIMTANPYIIIKDIDGFGFKKADAMALKIGIKPGSEARTMACILWLLEDVTMNHGNIWINGKRLCSEVMQALNDTAVKQRVRIMDMPDWEEVRKLVYRLRDNGDIVVQGERVFPKSLYDAELVLLRSVVK